MNGGAIIVCWVLLTRAGSTLFFDDFQTQWWISMQIYYLEGPPLPLNVLDLRRRRRHSDHPGNDTAQEEEEEERAFGGQRGMLFYDPCIVDIYMYFSVPFVVPLFTGGAGKSKKVRVKRDTIGGRTGFKNTSVVNKEMALVYGRQLFEFNKTDIAIRNHSLQKKGLESMALLDARRVLDTIRVRNQSWINGRTMLRLNNTVDGMRKERSQDPIKRLETALVHAKKGFKFNGIGNQAPVQLKRLDLTMVDAKRLFEFSNKSRSGQDIPLTEKLNVALIDGNRLLHFKRTIVGLENQTTQDVDSRSLFHFNNIINQSEHTTAISTLPSQSPVRLNDRLQCRNDSYDNASSSSGGRSRRKRTIFHDDHVVSYYLGVYFYINDVFYEVFYSYLDFFIPLGLSTSRSRGRAMDLIYDEVQMGVFVTIDVPFLVPILGRPFKDKYQDDYQEFEDY